MGKAKDCSGLCVVSVVGVLAAMSAASAAEPLSGGAQEMLKRPPELVAPTPSPVPVAPSAAAATNAAAQSDAASATTLTVKSFNFVGNSLFDAATLGAQIASYQNRPLTLAQLYDAADLIGKYYVSRGYLLASAVLPAQNVTDGTVTIEVIEGRIEKLSFTGLKSYQPADLEEYLPHIVGSIYRGEAFEKGLRNIDELPGLTGKAVLKPGTAYGTTDIVVETTEKRFEGQAFIDNSGRESVGERRMAVSVTANNPSGVGDSISVLGLRSTNDNLQYLYGAYAIPVGVSGARASFSYGYARFALDGVTSGLTGSNRTARADLSIPLVRSAANRFLVGLGVLNTNANSDFSGVALTQTKLTVAELSGNFAHTWDSKAVTQLTGNIGSNFKSYTPVRTDGQAFRLESDLQHFQPLPFGFQVFGRTTLVYSPDPLPDTQQFALGGPASVRGYAPSEVRGDWGYFGSLTVRRPFAVAKVVIGPRIFGDAGRVRQHTAGVDEVSLSSVGAGADVNYKNANLKLDYAVPLDGRATSDGRDDGRFYGSLSYDF